jgi:OOP family OmpA-OmpF porin
MKKSLLLASALSLAVLAAGPARAADTDHPWNDEVGQWFVAPFIGYTWLDSARLLDDGMYWGASLGKHLSKDWTAQITGYTGDYDNNGELKPEWKWPATFDATLSGVALDLMRVFDRDSRLSPYVVGGLGYQNDNYEGLEGDADVTAALGLGLMYDLYRNGDGSRTVQLRPEIRQRWDFASGETYSDTLASVGLALGWGPPRPAPKVEEPPPPPPPPPPPAKCSDEDGDGVCDADDKCPATPAGTTVDKVGCPCSQKLTVLFDFDKSELRPESITELERVVKFMNDVPFATALIEGHTDSIGTEAYNLALSDRRAKAVFDYLTSRGVNPDRLKSKGFGESQPVAPNDTAEGRQLNRRVMLTRTDPCPN